MGRGRSQCNEQWVEQKIGSTTPTRAAAAVAVVWPRGYLCPSGTSNLEYRHYQIPGNTAGITRQYPALISITRYLACYTYHATVPSVREAELVDITVAVEADAKHRERTVRRDRDDDV